jgi:DNA-binding transcriptional LysR family regulator
LGLTLMERTRMGIRITPSGRGVIQQIRRALGEVAAVEAIAHSNGVGSSGEVRLGFLLPPVAESALRLLREWRQRHPGILLRLFEMNDHEIRMALTERTIDAALVTRRPLWPGAIAIPIYREAILAALPNEHALTGYQTLTWDLLRQETMLTQGWNDGQAAGEFFRSLLGPGCVIVSHATSKQSILALVAAGYGVTLGRRNWGQTLIAR